MVFVLGLVSIVVQLIRGVSLGVVVLVVFFVGIADELDGI